MPTAEHSDQLTTRVILAYLGVYFIWGSTYLAIRIGVLELPPALFAGIRFIIAGSLMLAMGLLRGYTLPGWIGIRDLCIVGLFLLVGGNLLVVWAEKTIPSGLTALILGIFPLVIASFDALLPKGQQLSPIGWLGTIIGLAGVIILVSPSLGLVTGEHLNPLGIAALLLACILWTIGSLYGKYHHVEGNIFVNSGIQNFAPGIVALAIGIGSGEMSELHFTTRGTLALAYLIVFGTILGYTSYQYLLRHQPPAKASTYAYVNPIIAVFLGWLILDEPITIRTVVAAVVILGGVAMVQVSTMRKKA